MRNFVAALVLAVTVTGCGYVSEYERQVYDWEPVYCYRTLGAVQCHDAPDRTADKRLVNYYGPDPSRTDPPEAREEEHPDAPPAIDYWVKDPEPRPEPSVPEAKRWQDPDKGLKGSSGDVSLWDGGKAETRSLAARIDTPSRTL